MSPTTAPVRDAPNCGRADTIGGVERFSDLAANYRVLFLDAYGVLKNSSGNLPGIEDVLERLLDEGKHIYCVTNDASKSPDAMADQFHKHHDGPVLIPPERFVSSGLMVTDFLRTKIRQGRVAYLGQPASAWYIHEAGLEAVPLAQCDPDEEDVAALVLLDDEGFEWQSDVNRALNLLRARNIPVVVANADPVYPVKDSRVAVAVGTLGRMLEDLVGKHFIHFGKPDAYMLSFTANMVLQDLPDLKKSDVIMVGDTLETDIKGGNKFGIDTALVLSGNTSRRNAEFRIASTGIQPTFVCESILT